MEKYLKVVTWMYERAMNNPSPFVNICSNGRSRYMLERYATFTETIIDLYFNEECIVELSDTKGVKYLRPMTKGQERAVNTLSMLMLKREIC